MRRIVLKLGGSLLHQADWCARLLNLVGELGRHQYFLIVGGGDAIEAMRTLDRTHSLDEIAMHWRCVEMLRHTTDVAWEILQRSNLNIPLTRINEADSFESVSTSASRRFELYLVDSTAFYSESKDGLNSKNVLTPKAGWRTTTDAIAIYCAALIAADQCILLKSCEVPDDLTIAAAVRQGILDEESEPMFDQYSRVTLRKL